MTTLLWKEFKENFKYAVGGFLVIGFLMFFAVYSRIGHVSANAEEFTVSCWIYFQVLGIIIGILQTFPELKRDRWSFLCHRSQSMGTIFFSKIITGLIYYLSITITVFFFTAWVLSSAEEPTAPFYWRDLWANVVFIITGLMSYFAAFLCGIRQRRWYGTRFIPLIFSFMTSLYFLILATRYGNSSIILNIPSALIITVLLGITCWCHFTRSLEEIHKSLFCRIIHLVSMTMISIPVQTVLLITVIAIVMVKIGPLLITDTLYTRHVFDKKGNTYKVVSDHHLRKMISIEDVDHPERKLNVADYETKDKNGNRIFKNRLITESVSSRGDCGYFTMLHGLNYNSYINNQISTFSLYLNHEGSSFRWYYLIKEHEIVGYPYDDKKQIITLNCEFDDFIGIGENGYNYANGNLNVILLTSKNNGFFLFNPKKETIQRLEEPKIEKPIRSMQIYTTKDSKKALIVHEDEIVIHEALPRVLKDNGELVEPKLSSKEMAYWAKGDDSRYYHPEGYYPIHTIYIPGKKITSIPFKYPVPDFTGVEVAKVPNENRYLLVLRKSCWQNLIWPRSSMPTYLEVDDKGTVLRNRQLYDTYPGIHYAQFIVRTAVIPVGPLLGMITYDSATSTEVDEFYHVSFSSQMSRNPLLMWGFMMTIFLVSITSAAFTYWIGRRNLFTKKQLTQWVLFNFFLGWGGVLTMVVAHRWLGKVTCKSCGKKRLQTEMKCNHCEAEFPLPELDGTEIIIETRTVPAFEKVSSSAS